MSQPFPPIGEPPYSPGGLHHRYVRRGVAEVDELSLVLEEIGAASRDDLIAAAPSTCAHVQLGGPSHIMLYPIAAMIGTADQYSWVQPPGSSLGQRQVSAGKSDRSQSERG